MARILPNDTQRVTSGPLRLTHLGPPTPQRREVAYLSALAVTAAAVLVRYLLDPLMGDTLPLVTVFGAVAFAVWMGGYGPAVLSALSGYVACAYLFIEPRGELGLYVPMNVVGLVAYLRPAWDVGRRLCVWPHWRTWRRAGEGAADSHDHQSSRRGPLD